MLVVPGIVYRSPSSSNVVVPAQSNPLISPGFVARAAKRKYPLGLL